MASSQRTDEILAICGVLLRRGGVWTNGTPENGPPLRMYHFKMRAPVDIRYCAIAAPVPGTKTFRPIRPKQLSVIHSGVTTFVVKWDEKGRRRKTKDQRQRDWEFLVRREAGSAF